MRKFNASSARARVSDESSKLCINTIFRFNLFCLSFRSLRFISFFAPSSTAQEESEQKDNKI